MISQQEHERRMEFARGKAAQAWCEKHTETLEMDVRLAEAFANILVKEMYEPHLGCATNEELLNEISARIDLKYKTIPDGGNGDE